MGILAILGIIILLFFAFIGGSALGWMIKGGAAIFKILWDGCATSLGVIWAIFLFSILLLALLL